MQLHSGSGAEFEGYAKAGLSGDRLAIVQCRNDKGPNRNASGLCGKKRTNPSDVGEKVSVSDLHCDRERTTDCSWLRQDCV